MLFTWVSQILGNHIATCTACVKTYSYYIPRQPTKRETKTLAVQWTEVNKLLITSISTHLILADAKLLEHLSFSQLIHAAILGLGDLMCRIASARLSATNVDRNLRRVIKKAGASLDIEIILVRTTVRLLKPKLRVVEIFRPCLSMKSWISVLLSDYPHLVLGGFDVDQETEWRHLFEWFWSQYRDVDSSHPIFHTDGVDFGTAIPYATHGDEGRGLRSQAFMVQSFQMILSHLGPFTTNMSGHLG